MTKNSELAGDDDDDIEYDSGSNGHGDTAYSATSNSRAKPLTGGPNSNSSLATVASEALEKLAGITLAMPDNVTSTQVIQSSHGDERSQGTEVYLEINDFNQSDLTGHSTCRVQEQSEATNQGSATPPTLEDMTNKDNEGITSSTSSTSSTTTISSTESSTTLVSTPSSPCEIDTSKDMLTEGQAFAYVGLCLVTANSLFQALEGTETSHAKESLENFISKLIYRLYKHLDIDANTQRTIAQLPQMMIQPEDLLESFVADGTQRIVSSQQVDQSELFTSRPTTPFQSRHSRQGSTASQSSIGSFQHRQQQQHGSTPAANNNPQRDPSSCCVSSSISTSSSAQSNSGVLRESISSLRSDLSNSTSPMDSPSPESLDKAGRKHIEAAMSRSSTLANESPNVPRRSISSQKAITVDLRWTLIADLFLISISDSVYDSRARVLLKTVGAHLGLDWSEIVLFEKGIMKQLQSTTNDGLLKPDTKSRNDESRKKRMIMMGLATVGGGLVLGLSAGLFAPVIGAGIGAALAGAHITGATATAASAFLAGSGGIAVITSGAAVTGSGIAMKKMARRTAGIDTFEFLSIHDNKRVNVILTISGWLDIGEEDASLPFSTLDAVNGDHFALLWEPEMLMQLGNAIRLLATEVITLTAQEILKHTLLSALLSALAWPMALTRLGYLIDNPWSIALDRAKLAGLVLADSLLMRSYLGFRPVTLVGYSLGARVIFYCLLELGRLDAFGIVENAYLFGAPITASETQWRQARSAVAGEFVNGFLRNDWVLGFLFRATTGGLGTVAGLRPIDNVPGLNNMDLTSHVEGHLDYRVKIPLLMKLMGLKITSESFLDKEEAILYQRSLKINPNEVLKAPKPMMPSKAELAKSESLTENEKLQLEIAFRRQAPKAKIPNLDEIKGLTPEEKEALREALIEATATQGMSPTDSFAGRKQ
ncbi:hypothetical protein BGX27_002383 [Mortierella sp. AM989]|nr:hypothetical protein BGX27_002383 [Mortierella sp. AM989]